MHLFLCVNIMVTMTTIALILLKYVVKIMTMIKNRFIKNILELFFSLLKQYSMFNLNFHWYMHYKILMTLKLNNKKKSLVWFQSTPLSKYPNSSFYIQTSSCIKKSVQVLILSEHNHSLEFTTSKYSSMPNSQHV